MAHEKLRFNIVLRNKEHNDNNSALDPVYSDTKYGTHYSVYTKIVGNKDVDAEGEVCFKVDSMHFYVQNFSGPVTVGITKVVGFKSVGFMEDFNVDGFSNGRHLKGLIIMQGLNTDFSYDYTPDENYAGILYHGDLLEIEVMFEAITNTLSRVRETDQNIRDNTTVFVDTEFMERDGENIIFLPDGHARMEEVDNLKNGEAAYEDIITVFGPSRPCKMKMSDIYIK